MRITSVGLAAPSGAPRPMAWGAGQLCRPALDLDVQGPGRWNALARLALVRCLGSAPPPELVIVASSNGGAHGFGEDEWLSAFDVRRLLAGSVLAERSLPIVSTSCTSGAHAILLAERAMEQGARDALVLAVDILSAASIENFNSLRILARDHELPWQDDSSGFLPGEAAVALLLSTQGEGFCLGSLVATTDMGRGDGLARALGTVGPFEQAVLQGTGPSTADESELSALAGAAAPGVSISTTIYPHGHTIGASSVLGLALLAAGNRVDVPRARALDGRSIESATPDRSTAFACRALTGQVTAMSTTPGGPRVSAWIEPGEIPALSIPVLKSLVASAREHRPATPPPLLVVCLECPVLPPARTRRSGRILPSTVLEISPGFAASLVARCWGYAGPAIALVGAGASIPPGFARLLDCGAVVYVAGNGPDRAIAWRIPRPAGG